MKKFYMPLLLGVLFCLQGKAQVNTLTEGFNAASPSGWISTNLSTTIGTAPDWVSGATDVQTGFTGFIGAGHAYVSYNSTTGANTISNWYISPQVNLKDGAVISFYTRTVASATVYPDRLQVRLSTAGASTNVGASATDVGDFTILACDINPTLSSSATSTGGCGNPYPQAWTKYTITVSGVGSTPVAGRIAFRYFVTNGGPSGANSNLIGLDEFSYQADVCNGTPAGGSASANPSILCATGNSTLSFTGTSAPGIIYQWQSSPAGANSFTDIPSATSSTYNATGISASTDFRVKVTCTNGNAFDYSTIATVTISGVPANDAACSAIPLTLNGTAHCGNTTCATASGDPTFSSSTPNNTVWYTFTPATSGQYYIIMSRPAGVTTGLLNAWVGIYSATGSCPSLTFSQLPATTGYNLTAVDSDSALTPMLMAGTTYYLMVDGNTGAFGAYCIRIGSTATTPPAPCATLNSPANAATNVSYVPTISFSWNAVPGYNNYDLFISTTNPPTYATPINVTGTSTELSGAAASTTYYWFVAPKNAEGLIAVGCESNTRSFTTGAVPPPPANNDCAGATEISAYVPVTATTVSATQSQAAEACAGFTGTAEDDVWFKFTALQNGSVAITLTPYGSFDAVMIAYSGACGSLTSIGCADATAGGAAETMTLNGLVAGQTYYFRVYGYGSTATSVGSFIITASGAALPVSVTSFSGVRDGNIAKLNWTTATEINNAGFELQRSADGRSFSQLAFIPSKANNGNSSSTLTYNFNDVRPLISNGYYRLKQVDKDGKFNYSNVVVIKGAKVSAITMSSIYPNPVKNDLNVVLSSPTAERINLVITDLSGKVISNTSANIVVGDNNLQIPVASLAAGSYIIKAVCSNGCETAVQKFVKQ